MCVYVRLYMRREKNHGPCWVCIERVRCIEKIRWSTNICTINWDHVRYHIEYLYTQPTILSQNKNWESTILTNILHIPESKIYEKKIWLIKLLFLNWPFDKLNNDHQKILSLMIISESRMDNMKTCIHHIANAWLKQEVCAQICAWAENRECERKRDINR